VKHSRTIDAALAVAHVLIGAGLSLMRMPLPVKMAIWLVLALSLFRLLRLRDRALPAALRLQADGRLALVDADGKATECRVDAATTVMPWLVVLRFRTAQAGESLALPVDALGADGHRQLRAWLRWRASVDPD